ncbi:acyclic terpene utilization AtuA family protein [Verrucosispora sp. NA02020]|uniref:acyclic terpene utilization AtuA family protein n=1 Tax=Verrucosispora sp. NA02020 TaxID=2742132 RepID=UPI001590356A|nr:acyclic terpene utilization AtuA family protein [Verrucosispora sp. NA02020]QKW13791.1 acyclic terpene utilization AtuA family protein [Verrucosispora sp. NA02020]
MSTDDRSRVRFVAPAAVMGGGFSTKSFRAALQTKPDFIACDAGSTDWGPYYLGAAASWAGYRQTRRDLERMVIGALDIGVPLLIGSAGFTGSDAGLTWFRGIVTDILAAHGRTARIATIRTEQPKDWVLGKVRSGQTWGLDGRPELTEADVERATRIVAMMGPEPYAEALDAGAQIVLAGRSSDAAIYAAVPLLRGIAPGPAWHMGKTVECGYAIEEPIGAGECIVGEVDDEGFTVRPVGGRSRCTVRSVAAQMLYENATPYLLREPPGTLDTSAARYLQLDDQSVRVVGATFTPEPYSVRLEGVEQLGYRSMCLFGVRDPAVVANVADYTAAITDLVHRTARDRYGLDESAYTFGFRRYGYDAVLGAAEPNAATGYAGCYEIGLVAEAVAADQEIAHEIVSGAMPFFMHGVRVPGVANSANGALAYAPSVVDVGPVFTWSVWHGAALEHPMEPFTLEITDTAAVEKVTVNA